MNFNTEREAESLIKRLEKSNKIFAASAATEGWKLNRIFKTIKEKFPQAQKIECAGIIYLTARKEQEEQLIERLQKKRAKYEEMRKNGKYDFGTDKELTETYLKEIEGGLRKLEESEKENGRNEKNNKNPLPTV